MSPAHRDALLVEARRHEVLAQRLRTLAGSGDLLDKEALTAPIVHGWRWDSVSVPVLRGNWLRLDDTAAVETQSAPVTAHSRDMSAVLTLDGWFILGVPNDVRTRHEGVLQ